MKKINSKGFTLVELIATIVILSIVVTICAISITTVIKSSKEKDYELFIREVKNAVEEFYLECRFDKHINIECPSLESEYYSTTLESLVNNGYLKGNSIDENHKLMVVNPKDNVNISSCQIKYNYQNGKISVVADNPTGSCPTRY